MPASSKAILRGAALIGVLLLAACMLAPGKFDSQLDVRQDGRFTFNYVGQIHFLPLSQRARDATFSPESCSGDDGEERPCTAAELAEQRRNWEAGRAEREAEDRREAQSMQAFTGNLDVSDPRAGEELAARLRRQAGWRRVDYRGDGLFDVDFRISGTLDHDFTFPTLENFPLANAFVQLTRRNDGTIRIDAPGFAQGMGAEGLGGMAGSLMGGTTSTNANVPTAEGRFVLATDAQILANNTDEGPQAVPSGQQLAWTINLRSTAAPMALLRLAP
jgi:hypothetical protein